MLPNEGGYLYGPENTQAQDTRGDSRSQAREIQPVDRQPDRAQAMERAEARASISDTRRTDAPTRPHMRTRGENCPDISAVRELSFQHRFAEDQARIRDNLLSGIEISRMNTACKTVRYGTKVEIYLTFSGRLGPAGQNQGNGPAYFTYPYFLAVVNPDGTILSKDLFNLNIIYDRDQEELTRTETLIKTLPVPEKGKAGDYSLLIGFQIDKDQLSYNRDKIKGESPQIPLKREKTKQDKAAGNMYDTAPAKADEQQGSMQKEIPDQRKQLDSDKKKKTESTTGSLDKMMEEMEAQTKPVTDSADDEGRDTTQTQDITAQPDRRISPRAEQTQKESDQMAPAMRDETTADTSMRNPLPEAEQDQMTGQMKDAAENGKAPAPGGQKKDTTSSNTDSSLNEAQRMEQEMIRQNPDYLLDISPDQ